MITGCPITSSWVVERPYAGNAGVIRQTHGSAGRIYQGRLPAPGTHSDRVLKALRRGPGTSHEIAMRTGMTAIQASGAIAKLHAKDIIKAYGRRGWQIAVVLP